MNAVSRVSSLSLALPVSNVPFSSSFVRPLSLSSFLVLSVFVPPFLFGPSPSLLSCSALNSRNPFISRSRFRGSVPFFPLPTYMFAFPSPLSPPRQPRPCFAALYARAFPASPALRFVPTACVSTAKSIDRNVFRSGRNERECNRREWGGI